MKLSELLSVLDENENIQITYRVFSTVKKAKEQHNNILDLQVKKVKLEGCSMLFVEVE